MLVISRKKSESFLIGNNIEIIVTDIGSDRVELGIKAPKGVPILRRELLETEKLNREAASSVPEKGTVEKLKKMFGGKG
ncbi:MAG TPA: carbon storage regulator [Ruminococcaceae bacterium]|jgi:carbon storage regulator|nr:carbon storage regulator [Oscillospiraceae bacterium]